MASRIPTFELKQAFNPSGQVIHQVVLVLPSPRTRLCAGVVHTITGNVSFDSSLIDSGHTKVSNIKAENKTKGCV